MSCLVDRVLEPLAREGVLPSEVDVATVGPGCESRDRERLEHREGVELHHEPILERPWLGLVGVADHVVGAHGLLGDRLPLRSRGERGAKVTE